MQNFFEELSGKEEGYELNDVDCNKFKLYVDDIAEICGPIEELIFKCEKSEENSHNILKNIFHFAKMLTFYAMKIFIHLFKLMFTKLSNI